jgi:arsenate reductase (thioredoxin)
MADRLYDVLFLCTGNSARSILAEGILRKDGAGRFSAYSAGSQPNGQVNLFALKTLEAYNYPALGYDSKSWDEFAGPDAPVMDFVFTVCDQAGVKPARTGRASPSRRIGALRTPPPLRAPMSKRSGPSIRRSGS